MKKVVLSLAVLFSIAMVSCGGNKQAEATDSDSMMVAEETITDTVAVEPTSAGEVPAEAAK